jgi:hypothetical protein
MSAYPHAAITAAIAHLSAILSEASGNAAEAKIYADQRRRNAAIGTLASIEQSLTDALALYRALVVLHRGRPL